MLFRSLGLSVIGALVANSIATGAASQNEIIAKKRMLPSNHVVHEKGKLHWGTTWKEKMRVPDDALLPMRIGLKQSNLDIGHDILMDISNPESSNFGKHMTSEEVIALFKPPRSSVEAVVDWLTASGIDIDRITQSANKQWIQFDASASEAGDLLFTEYNIYEHVHTNTQNIACKEYYVPKKVQEHIDYITPGTRLRPDRGRIHQLRHKRSFEGLDGRGIRPANTGLIPVGEVGISAVLPPLNSTICDRYVTNQCIRNQYSIPRGTKNATGNELGVFESLNQHYSKNDLDTFWATLYPRIPVGTYPEERNIDGAFGAATQPSEVGAESNLDFEAAWPLIWPQKAVNFQTDDNVYEINQTDPATPYLGFWNTFYDALDGSYCTFSAYGETGNCVKPECLDPSYPNPAPGGYKGALQCGVYKPTNVISISYGGGEADIPAYYWKRQCDEIMKLSLQGVTVVISSGDYGVGSYPGDGGLPSGCTGKDGRVFFPASDATCPYVLAVGGTEFTNSTVGKCKRGERATARFPSGGGFSNYFDMPEYQAQAVKTYFDTVTLGFKGYENAGNNFSDVGDGVYKIGGRGYPDVAAIGDYFVVRTGGQWGRIGGTSLSAPVWAAMLTLVNEERIAAGKRPVGFVNKILYQHPEVFNDITEGSNPNCKSTGFLAAKGWDPVTGLGSPKFPKLVSLLLGMP